MASELPELSVWSSLHFADAPLVYLSGVGGVNLLWQCHGKRESVGESG
jgi:hypothetical protein